MIVYEVNGTQIREVEAVDMTDHWVYMMSKTAIGINTKIKKSKRNLRGGYFETLEAARENVRLRLNKEIREIEDRVKVLKGQLKMIPEPPKSWKNKVKTSTKKAAPRRGSDRPYWTENKMHIGSAFHVLEFGKTGPLTASSIEGAKILLKWDEDRINSRLKKPITKAQIKSVFGLDR